MTIRLVFLTPSVHHLTHIYTQRECAKVLAPAAVSEKPLDLEHACASLRSGQQLHKLSVVLH